jgi:hypothetical protein
VGDADLNQCNASENTVVITQPADQRASCGAAFDLDWSKLKNPPASVKRIAQSRVGLLHVMRFDLLGRQP